ncbi:MAG: polyprenyl synthetase family protein [Melioribacteraceae bacterium]|nr:polyprenyl synthetase family protein [Melioribacteraceae bacterium]
MKNQEKYLKEYLKEREKIESKLGRIFNKKNPDSLYQPSEYGLGSGGKRLRPFLVLISAKAVGGKYSQVYNAALAVEIFHNFTLVHDDIMDNADKRRNLLTMHLKYDINTAILAGDNMLGYAYKMLLKDCNENAKEVINRFTEAMIEVCEGQSYDTDFELKKNVSIPEYKVMIAKKTAALAEVCCSIGGLLGGGNRKQIDALTKYGRNLGMAFQIQDDLLDIMGDEDKFGKSVGGDLVAGKKTFLFLLALERAVGEDKLMLQKVIENKGIRKNQVKKYKLLYEKLGIIEKAEKEIENYTNKALKAIEIIEVQDSRNMFEWLANMLIKRKT